MTEVERARALLAGLGGDAKSAVTKEKSRTFADQSAAALAAAVRSSKMSHSWPREV